MSVMRYPVLLFQLQHRLPTPAKSREPAAASSRLLAPAALASKSARILHDVPGIEHGRSSPLASFEAEHDIIIEFRFASDRSLGDGDRPVLHIGERLSEI